MNRWVRCKIGIWFVLSFILVGSQGMDPVEKRLFQLFEELGIETTRYVIQHTGRLTTDLRQSEVDQFIEKLGKSLNSRQIEKEVSAEGIKYHASGKFQHDWEIHFHLLNDEPQKTRVRPYLTILLMGDGKTTCSSALQARVELQEILMKYGIDPVFFYSIQGKKESVSSSDPQGLLMKALTKLKADEVEAMKTKQTTSISAFSPLFPERLKTKGGWMNVQMATHIDLQNSKIIVTLGTPIIMIEY
jgi:hypothetical protein